MQALSVNVLILGGGAAGLWLLDEVRRRGLSALLLEATDLGQGQTVCPQGILHSGLKYMLDGLPTAAAKAAREMPLRWKDCLRGRQQPDLTGTELRSSAFHLWGTESASSRLGLLGAQLGLRVTPHRISAKDYPLPLRGCRGIVLRVDEQIISPSSLIQSLAARNAHHLLKIDPVHGLKFHQLEHGTVESVGIQNPENPAHELSIRPDQVVLAAGSGNGALRERLGFDSAQMQLRPLHMVQIRGNLPEFYGHCVEGSHTRVSITSAQDSTGRRIWQVGGQIAEDGVSMSADEVIHRCQAEISHVMPHLSLLGTEWSSYWANRAEGATLLGKRPDSYRILQEKNILTAWPTKLVLVPQLVDAICVKLGSLRPKPLEQSQALDGFARPAVALPPWETLTDWIPWRQSSRAAA
ncbi:MAG: FAD-dependent oxidoreductase [Planctomycetales bacterium]